VAAGLAGCHRADERVLEGRPFELSGTRRFELAPPFEHARAELLVCARFEGECRPEQESTRPQLPFTARAYSGRSEGAFPLRTARSLPKRCERCLWHKGLPGGAYPWVELTAASPVRVESLRIVSLDPP
jgi:hypothetical protein